MIIIEIKDHSIVGNSNYSFGYLALLLFEYCIVGNLATSNLKRQ